MTPWRKLRMERQISKLVTIFPVIQLEKLTDLYQKIFPLPGYHVSTNDYRAKAEAISNRCPNYFSMNFRR
jgi:hypothetical protein